MGLPVVLILRAVQALFALIVLALTAYGLSPGGSRSGSWCGRVLVNAFRRLTLLLVASWFNDRVYSLSPSQVNFLIFTSVWTLVLALPYLSFALKYYPKAAHKFAVLAVEFITMIFWFAGFIALGVYVGDLWLCRGNVCRSAQAAIVFSAFDWLLFAVTTGVSAAHVWRTRNSSSSEPAPAMQTV